METTKVNDLKCLNVLMLNVLAEYINILIEEYK